MNSTLIRDVKRIAAFSMGNKGGNPAGVYVGNKLPEDAMMQQIAAEIGYSETVFAAPSGDGWRVRYFSPEAEVAFCGHATIALGSVLAQQFGNGIFRLSLNEADIVVEGTVGNRSAEVSLQSPPTRSKPASEVLIEEVLSLFGFSNSDINMVIPPAIIHAGNDHFCLVLNSREALAQMTYDLQQGKALMNREKWITILLAWPEHNRKFHVRNAFASSGVYEDPATGAAAAAFGGYLRDIDWPHEGKIELLQGEDMHCPSLLKVSVTPIIASSIRISGETREIDGN